MWQANVASDEHFNTEMSTATDDTFSSLVTTITLTSPSSMIATTSTRTRNESSAIIASPSSSSSGVMITATANSVATSNTVNRDQNNYQTTYIFNTPQNTTAGPGSLNGITPSTSFNDAPLGLLSAHFSGRQDELAHMIKAFEVMRGDVPTCFGLYAGPGVGKSQLTLALAKESFAQGRYKCIFWIPATTVEKVHQGLSKLLHLVGHQDRFRPEEMVRLTAARRWLEEFGSGRWLLVLDNVVLETVDFLREHLPRKNNLGNILYTTRTKDVAMALANTSGEQHEILELCIPNEEDAARLLLGHFRDGELDGDRNTVQKIVRCVGCLPLAISQAASYMRQTGITLDALLTIYNSELKIDMMKWENELSTYQEKSVAATFTYQLDDLQQHFPDVSNLLKILAYFDPESIPLDMLITGANFLSNSQPQTVPDSVTLAPQKTISFADKVKNKLLRSQKGSGKGRVDETSSAYTVSAEMSSLLALIKSPMSLPNAIAQLQQRSLTKQQGTGRSSSLWMHDLTRLIVMDNTKQGGDEREWFENAVELACSSFNQVQAPQLPESWARCEVLIPHIQSLTIREGMSGGANSSLLFANYRIAGYLRSRGRYSDAEVLLKQVLLIREKLLGQDHVDTLNTKHNLAVVYDFQGRYRDAELLYNQALSSSEKRLGPEHVDTLTTMNTLARVYVSQGRYSDAEVLYNQVYSSQEKLLGPEHVNTLNTKGCLALVYDCQGRYMDAEVLFKQVLSSKEKLLGPEHVDTLSTKHNLASIYNSHGRYAEAETLLLHVIAGRERWLGLSHPDTQRSQSLLAKVYTLLDDAEKMIQSVSSSSS